MPTPTVPPSGLLDISMSKAIGHEVIETAAPLLAELVNYGVATLARCASEVGGGDVHLGVFLPFRNLLEMLDGVRILVADAAPSAERPQLRSMLESLLTIEYVTEPGIDKLAYALRACAWLVADLRQAIAEAWSLRMYDPETEEGRLLLARQRVTYPIDLDKLDRLLTLKIARLNRPPWCQLNDALIAAHQGRKPWFVVDKTYSPPNLFKLAHHLGRTNYYDTLYRGFSTTMHGGGVAQQMEFVGPGQSVIRRLRAVDDFETVVAIAVDLACDTITTVLVAFRPEEYTNYSRWFLEVLTPMRRTFDAAIGRLGDVSWF